LLILVGALVIGGGLSGLGAALLLSRLGRQVVLVEKSPRLGAVVRGFQRRSYSFETGFHYAGGLSEDGVLYRYLQKLGLFRHGLKIRPLPDPGGEFLRFPASGVDFALPRCFDEFRRLFPGAPEVDDFFSRCREVFTRSPYLNPDISAFDPLAWYNNEETLAASLDRLPVSQHLKNVLGFRCLLYGVKPSEASFDQFALVNASYFDGGFTFKGGGEALVRAFEASLLEAGVTVLTGCEVAEIKIDRLNVAVAARYVDSHGQSEEIDFAECVYSGSPAKLPHLLPEGALRPVLCRRLLGRKYTPSPLMVFGLTRSNWMEDRQLFICPERQEDWLEPAHGAIYASGGQGHNSRWPVSVVTIASKEGTAPWLQPDLAYQAWKARLAEEASRHLLDNCPELDGDFEIVESATSRTLERHSLAFGPGIYGQQHGVGQVPILPVTRVGRLVLAGQNIVLPGLLGALVSSALATGFLTNHDAVLEVLK
jgi:all-trans-retinol 13,14-reductase